MTPFESYLLYFPLTEVDLQKSILDVGTGSGEFIKYIRETLGNTQAIGIDNDPEGFKGEKYLLSGDGLALPFVDNSFEIVLARHYIPMFFQDEIKWKQAITELIRVAKPGGKIMFDYIGSDVDEVQQKAHEDLVLDLHLKGSTVEVLEKQGSPLMVITK